MKKIMVLGFLVLVVIAVGMLAYYYFINISFYNPGEIATNENINLEPSSQVEAENNYWRVEDDVNLYNFSEGEGRPVLVVHGGPGIPSERPWQGLQNLTSDFKFYYYHQRGCGDSTRPIEKFDSKNYYQNMKDLDANLGMGQQIADIERIRKILNQDKLIIIGHSYGGFMATLYALEFPQNVEKLVLVNPAGVLKLPQTDQDMNMFSVIGNNLSVKDKEAFDDWQDEYFDFGRLFEKDEKSLQQLNYEFIEYYEKYLAEQDMSLTEQDRSKRENIGGWMVQAIYLSLGRSYDYRQELLDVEVPTIIIQGGQDFSVKSAYEYESYLGNTKLEFMESAGHFIYNEIPDEFGDRVGSFLRR